MTVGEVLAWVAAHAPLPQDDRPLAVKADEVARALGWTHGV